MTRNDIRDQMGDPNGVETTLNDMGVPLEVAGKVCDALAEAQSLDVWALAQRLAMLSDELHLYTQLAANS